MKRCTLPKASFGLACIVWLGSALAALALDEDRVLETVPAHVETGQTCAGGDAPFWTRHHAVNPEDRYRVRFSRFGCVPGPRGGLIVAPGRGEASVEYYETALDFTAKGFGPVYVVDHRGQGFSPRLLPDPDKSHVGDFSDYVTDFAAVVAEVTGNRQALGAPPDSPLYFMSNSMGGAIGIGYFQAVGADNPFAAAALAGPMIRVNYISFTDRKPTWLNLQIYSEDGAQLQANWRCGVAVLWNADRCTDFASPGTFGPYQPGPRVFTPDTERLMTHSQARLALRDALWDDIDWQRIAAEDYGPDEHWTGPQLGGSTNRWVQTTTRFNKSMRRSGSLEKMQTMPILIMMGTRDLRGYRPYRQGADRPPDLGHAKGLCDDLNEISARAGRYICSFVAIEGGFHELFKESDLYRDRALATIDWFFRLH